MKKGILLARILGTYAVLALIWYAWMKLFGFFPAGTFDREGIFWMTHFALCIANVAWV